MRLVTSRPYQRELRAIVRVLSTAFVVNLQTQIEEASPDRDYGPQTSANSIMGLPATLIRRACGPKGRGHAMEVDGRSRVHSGPTGIPASGRPGSAFPDWRLLAYDAGRTSGGDLECWNVPGHDAARSNNCTFANRHSRQNRATGPDPSLSADANRAGGLYFRERSGSAPLSVLRMRRIVRKRTAGGDQHIVLDHDALSDRE
jgi:hypothetical protein